MLQLLYSSHLRDVEQLRVHDSLGREARGVGRGTGGAARRGGERAAERRGLERLAADDGIGGPRPRVGVA